MGPRNRVFRQIFVLTQKNLLLFYKAPISTVLRALLFPLAITLVFCYLRSLLLLRFPDQGAGDGPPFADARRISTLAQAIDDTSVHKLVFVLDGAHHDQVDPIIDGIFQQPGMAGKPRIVLDDPDDLYEECPRTLFGQSYCFATVLFEAVNSTDIVYTIALGEADAYPGITNFRTHSSTSIRRIMPLQWALDAQLGGFPAVPTPLEVPFQYDYTRGYGGYVSSDYLRRPRISPWISYVGAFAAPLFGLILVGISYHIAVQVASERETGLSELLAAQTCSIIPRVLSTFLSFTILYLPGWIICGTLIAQILFIKCSTVVILFLTILAGLSFMTSAHMVGSFFRKAQLSGLYTAIITFAFAFVYIAFSLDSNPQLPAKVALAAIFPPFTFANLVGDIASAEEYNSSYSLTGPSSYYDDRPRFDGYLYFIFFTVQILAYSAAVFIAERYIWGVKRPYKIIKADSDVALRLTNLSKTYTSANWFSRSTTVKAVDALNLGLKKGSVGFLLGPNGGGKTTTLKCIAGMTAMDGQSQLEINEDSTELGICPQGNVLWDNLTVKQNLRFWRLIKTAGSRNNGVDVQGDEEILQECDLIEKQHAKVRNLSGGQMRKLQLAISFVGGSKIICVDEATSGLDPLSRRNIWKIITNSRSRRTILMTTHFLDEADALADQISIVYKGRLVCTDTPTALKTRYGGSYTIRQTSFADHHHGDSAESLVWKVSTSTAATKKLLELKKDSDDSYAVDFPTLDDVFLKVTGSTHDQDPPKPVRNGELSNDRETSGEENLKAAADLESGRGTGFFKQVAILLRKRYILLRHNWISFLIAVLVPVVITAALAKATGTVQPMDRFFYSTGGFRSCEKNLEQARMEARRFNEKPISSLNAVSAGSLYYGRNITLGFGPPDAFDNNEAKTLYLNQIAPIYQHYIDELCSSGSSTTPDGFGTGTIDCREANLAAQLKALELRKITSSLDSMYDLIEIGTNGFGIFAPNPTNITLVHSDDLGLSAIGMNLLTSQMASWSTTNGTAKKITPNFGIYRTIRIQGTDFRILPLNLFVLFAYIASTSVSIIYPTFERVRNSRALQYCNGVTPLALWTAYLIFEMQILIPTAFITWGLLYGGAAAQVWFESSYILGALILFGIASYLGCFLLSMFVKTVAFAIAACIHLLLAGLYLGVYLLNDRTDEFTRDGNFIRIHAGLGLTSPAANLLRAFFVAGDSYNTACPSPGTIKPGHPFSYRYYGGVYLNLIIQIVFLILAIAVKEYGNTEWLQKAMWWKRRAPDRLRYVVENGETAENGVTEKVAKASASLVVSKVTKYFGKLFATQSISFTVSPNETLALLGPNGAGKTTTINMIRGLIKPNYGDITVENVSVLTHPAQTRIHLGVCPQDDAIDELNVRQTLEFYAAIKGVKNVKKNVDAILAAFNITQFERTQVKKLSGGTRRKLMCCVALVGNPRCLLLDEPSTGQDAGAKRTLWKILETWKLNRAILLTTHSMEETEALADNIAILATKMLATGTLDQLRSQHGGFYRVRATLVEGLSADAVTDALRDSFGSQMSGLTVRYGQLEFKLPHDARELGHILGKLERLKVQDNGEDSGSHSRTGSNVENGQALENHHEVFVDYTLNGPTMDEVFMNVCQRNQVE